MTLNSQTVEPDAIQGTLNKIWESLETTNTTRACLFNLIFYSQKNSRTPYVQTVIQKVIEKFPSRVIFITYDKEAKKDFLDTRVSILSSSQGEFDVACDYIQIDAGGAWQERIAFVLLPHILPDLPIYLIWVDDIDQNNPLFLKLHSFASRLIFDSETTENLDRFAKTLLQLHASTHIDIADLNWARIESWRDLLSMVFYSKENLAHIERAVQIEISYNAQASPFFCHTQIQAMYLQTWIASQLQWKPQATRKEKEQVVFSYQTPFTSVEVHLVAKTYATLPPGLILGLEVKSMDQITYRFLRNLEKLHCILLHAFDAHKCEVPAQYILPKAESGYSLVKEITHRGTSKHFLKVLNLLDLLHE